MSLSPNILLIVEMLAFLFGMAAMLLHSLRFYTHPPALDVFDNQTGAKATIRSTGVFSVVKYPALSAEFFMFASLAIYITNIWFLLFFVIAYPMLWKREVYLLDKIYLKASGAEAFEEWNRNLNSHYPKPMKFKFPRAIRNKCTFPVFYPILYALLLSIIHLLREYSVFSSVEISGRPLILLGLGICGSLLLIILNWRNRLKNGETN